MIDKFFYMDDIINRISYGDMIKLEIPTSVKTDFKVYGIDFAVGYFVGICDVCDTIKLSSTQKQAYLLQEGITEYKKEHIKSYVLLEKYIPKPEEDGIDKIICSILDDCN